MTKLCTLCATSKALNAFENGRNQCKVCRSDTKRKSRIKYYHSEKGRAAQKRWNDSASARAYRRAWKLRNKYNLTVHDYNQLLALQNGHCVFCNKTDDLVVDHDHATGNVRGILCRQHNTALGLFQDSPLALQLAIEYVTTRK